MNGSTWAGLLILAWGWLWGSFINQVVDRTPRRGEAAAPSVPSSPPHPLAGKPIGKSTGKMADKSTGRPMGIFYPTRSICFVCGQTLAWHENLPLFSYLWLRGACRHCGSPIGARTLVMELAMPIAFALLFWAGATRGLSLWMMPFPFLLWGWLQLAAALMWEKRRPGFWFWLSGIGSLAGVGFPLVV